MILKEQEGYARGDEIPYEFRGEGGKRGKKEEKWVNQKMRVTNRRRGKKKERKKNNLFVSAAQHRRKKLLSHRPIQIKCNSPPRIQLYHYCSIV